MSEPNATAFPIEPIWTPQDFADTVRDASQHEAIHGVPLIAENMQPDPEPVGMRPSAARRTERLIVAVAVLLMVCSLGVAWLIVVVAP